MPFFQTQLNNSPYLKERKDGREDLELRKYPAQMPGAPCWGCGTLGWAKGVDMGDEGGEEMQVYLKIYAAKVERGWSFE